MRLICKDASKKFFTKGVQYPVYETKNHEFFIIDDYGDIRSNYRSVDELIDYFSTWYDFEIVDEEFDFKDGMIITFRNGETGLYIQDWVLRTNEDQKNPYEECESMGKINKWKKDKSLRLWGKNGSNSKYDIMTISYMGKELWKTDEKERVYVSFREAYDSQKGVRFNAIGYETYLPMDVVLSRLSGEMMKQALSEKKWEIEPED